MTNNTPFKIFEKDGFKFEVGHTYCGTLAYKFYVDGEEVYRNNNYYPTQEALDNDKVMFEELHNMIMNDENRTFWSIPSEEKFIHSEKFKKFKALDKSI
jgi:hypothetical protein